jgi:hypothetical protein
MNAAGNERHLFLLRQCPGCADSFAVPVASHRNSRFAVAAHLDTPNCGTRSNMRDWANAV